MEKKKLNEIKAELIRRGELSSLFQEDVVCVDMDDAFRAVHAAYSLGEQVMLEKIRPFVERVRLDVDVMVCDCGEKYKDSDLDLSVGELEQALTPTT